METQTENIAQVDNGEMFRAILDATLTSMGEMLGQMAAWAEPYFPLGAIEAVWLQALLAVVIFTVCMHYRRDLTHLGTLLRRADSELATQDITAPAAPIEHREAAATGHRVSEVSLNFTGTLVGGYALMSVGVGLMNVCAWVFVAIGGW